MANALPPPQPKMPLVDANGMASTGWFAFFRELYNRVGGATGEDEVLLLTTLSANVTTLNTQVNDLGQGRAL